MIASMLYGSPRYSILSPFFCHRADPVEPPLSESNPRPEISDTHFSICVTAARNTVQLVKDVSRISPEPLLNPHLIIPFYLTCIILIIQWRKTKDDSLKADIDMLELVFDRFCDVFPALGKKFRAGFAYARDDQSISQFRSSGIRGSLENWKKWFKAMLKDDCCQNAQNSDIIS